MNSISFFKALLLKEMEEELKIEKKKLSKKQMDIADEAEPLDKITRADFKALQAKKGMKKEVDTPNPPTDYGGKPSIPGLGPIVHEDHQDHEVSMAQNSLKSIISSASQLMNLLGQDEKDVPAWIQDHITNAENFINQASKNYHEYNGGEHDMDELPDGTEELPAGDAEDMEMSLQSLMEISKSKKKRK